MGVEPTNLLTARTVCPMWGHDGQCRLPWWRWMRRHGHSLFMSACIGPWQQLVLQKWLQSPAPRAWGQSGPSWVAARRLQPFHERTTDIIPTSLWRVETSEPSNARLLSDEAARLVRTFRTGAALRPLRSDHRQERSISRRVNWGGRWRSRRCRCTFRRSTRRPRSRSGEELCAGWAVAGPAWGRRCRSPARVHLR
jgi:hypothetical protein